MFYYYVYSDGKTYDAFIAYSESDTDINLVVKVLMPALQKAGYVPFIRDIDAIPGESKSGKVYFLHFVLFGALSWRHSARQSINPAKHILLHQSRDFFLNAWENIEVRER